MMSLLLLACFGVIVGPGWSEPFVATDSANTTRRIQFLYHDEIGRNHLIWAGFNDESRIAYKMFSTDGGTELYPETMISDDVNSAYLTTATLGDSLYSFWRTYSPIYTAARNISDGSEAVPPTYLLTTSTMIPQVRSSADSLGRLHVLYDGGFEGMEVFYAVWSPSPDSGFTTEYKWIIEGANDGGVILVDGNRVHVVVQDSLVHNYLYIQYDLEGNTVVPLTDFTSVYMANCSRFPVLQIDSERNLLIIEEAFLDPTQTIYFWKLDGETGNVLIDVKPLVIPEPPEMDTSVDFIVSALPEPDRFYLFWCGYAAENKMFYKVFDSEGNTVVSWQLAYDYSDEDPEDIHNPHGVVDTAGNLFVIFSQVETEPQIDYFPTFCWFDYSTLGIENSSSDMSCEAQFTVSQNPVTGSVTVFSDIDSPMSLRVFDLAGREVSSISVSGGIGVWNGTGFSGEKLPAGIYNIIDISGYIERITLLDQ